MRSGQEVSRDRGQETPQLAALARCRRTGRSAGSRGDGGREGRRSQSIELEKQSQGHQREIIREETRERERREKMKTKAN